MNVETNPQLALGYPGNCIITGEGNLGQLLVAMEWVRASEARNCEVFHNGCAKGGHRVTWYALSNEIALAELIASAPDESLFLLADADCLPELFAHRRVGRLDWLALCEDKRHSIVATTMRGREGLLGPLAFDGSTHHYQVETAYGPDGLVITCAGGPLRECFPSERFFAGLNTVERWARYRDGTYRSPNRPSSELIRPLRREILVPVDYTDAVRSTDTAKPKHPANSLLLTQVLDVGNNRRIKTTEIVGLVWSEAVNKRRDEEMAMQLLEWAFEKWGMTAESPRANPKPKYPDFQITIADETVNVEMTKVSPIWPSERPFSFLASSAQAGAGREPVRSPEIRCEICKTIPVPEIGDIHQFPAHDETHAHTCTYPGRMAGMGWTGDITALPELRIDPDKFEAAIQKAIDSKERRRLRCGLLRPNWLALIVEGFRLTDSYLERLCDVDWRGFDGVFATFSDQFGSAMHGLHPDESRHLVMLKCPGSEYHTCYHPGYILTVRKDDGKMNPLRGGEREIGVVHQIVSDDGMVLAEYEVEPPQPITEADLRNKILAASIGLPHDPDA